MSTNQDGESTQKSNKICQLTRIGNRSRRANLSTDQDGELPVSLFIHEKCHPGRRLLKLFLVTLVDNQVCSFNLCYVYIWTDIRHSVLCQEVSFKRGSTVVYIAIVTIGLRYGTLHGALTIPTWPHILRTRLSGSVWQLLRFSKSYQDLVKRL